MAIYLVDDGDDLQDLIGVKADGPGGFSRAVSGDIVKIISDITIGSDPLFPASGVTVTASDGVTLTCDIEDATGPTQREGAFTYRSENAKNVAPSGTVVPGNVQPQNVTISHFTVVGQIVFQDATNCLIDSMVVDGDTDTQPGSNEVQPGIELNVYNASNCSLTIKNTEIKNIPNDGFTLNYRSGGSVSDANGTFMYIRNCTGVDNIGGYLEEADDTGDFFANQVITTHALGTIIVQGGTYGPCEDDQTVAAGNTADAIIIEDATLSGNISATQIVRCTIDASTGSGNFILTPSTNYNAKLEDTTITGLILFQLAGTSANYTIKRTRFTGDTTDGSSLNPMIRSTANNQDVNFESCIIEDPRSSPSGTSRAFGAGSGTTAQTRYFTFKNCLFYNWDNAALFNAGSRFAVAGITVINTVFLANAVNTWTASGTDEYNTGECRNNYHDVPSGDDAIINSTEFPLGNGASAYTMADYSSRNFRPLLKQDNFIYQKGAPLDTLVYDIQGKLFNSLSPDVGPYSIFDWTDIQLPKSDLRQKRVDTIDESKKVTQPWTTINVTGLTDLLRSPETHTLTQYQIYLPEVPFEDGPFIDLTSNQEYTNSDLKRITKDELKITLKNNTKFQMRARFMDITGWTEWSDLITFKTRSKDYRRPNSMDHTVSDDGKTIVSIGLGDNIELEDQGARVTGKDSEYTDTISGSIISNSTDCVTATARGAIIYTETDC